MARVATGVLADTVGLDKLHGTVPIGAVVASGFPRMGHDDGIVVCCSPIHVPLVPSLDLGQKRTQSRLASDLVLLPDGSGEGGRDRRLRYAGRSDWPLAFRAPNVRPRIIAWVILMEQNVGHHAIWPLPREQGFDFLPGAIHVKCRKAPGCECAVPVPLIRVQASRRHRVPTPVVPHQYGSGNIVECYRIHTFTLSLSQL